jgi:hypothetical protein
MSNRGKWLAVSGLGLLTGAWFAAQMLLGRHALVVMRQQEIVMHDRFMRMHPAPLDRSA